MQTYFTWEGLCELAPQGLAHLCKSTSFAKLLWPVRRSEAMPQSIMRAAGTRFQPGHAGSMPCLAPSDSKIGKGELEPEAAPFLILPFTFPPLLQVFLIIFFPQAHWRATEKATVHLSYLFPLPLAITTSPIVKRIVGRILLLCYSTFYKAIKEKVNLKALTLTQYSSYFLNLIKCLGRFWKVITLQNWAFALLVLTT